MASNKKIELVSSQDSPTGVAGQNVNGVFIPNPPKPVSPVKALTPEAISEPVTAMTVTPPEPTTGSIGMLGSIMEGTDQFTQNLEQQRTSAEANKKTALDAYIDSLGTPGKEEMTADLYAQNDGVDEIQTELNNINDQLRKEARGLDLRLRELDKNAQGLWGGALEQAKQKATDESLQRQADLSIIQMGIQGRYDSAKAIADRAVTVLTERNRARQEALRTIYEDNKEAFTMAEQREFETKQRERDRALQNEEYRLRAQFDETLRRSDPLYQLQIERARKEIALLGEETPTERAKREKEEVAALKGAQTSIPIMQDKVTLVDALKTHPGMRGSVGAYALARFTPFDIDKADKREFIGSVQKLLGGLTLDNLIQAKARGATFGALSDAELNILSSSASAINTWAKKDKNGNVTGYEIGEAEFVRELENIKQLTQRALTLSGQNLISNDEDALLDYALEELVPLNPQTYYVVQQ